LQAHNNTLLRYQREHQKQKRSKIPRTLNSNDGDNDFVTNPDFCSRENERPRDQTDYDSPNHHSSQTSDTAVINAVTANFEPVPGLDGSGTRSFATNNLGGATNLSFEPGVSSWIADDDFILGLEGFPFLNTTLDMDMDMSWIHQPIEAGNDLM
jgi:hypothetical protein